MNRFEKIKHFRGEINKLIKERPSLRSFQDNIDNELKKAKTSHNKMVTLHNMLIEHRGKLVGALKSLVETVKK